MTKSVKIPRNISKETKSVLLTIHNEGVIVEANLENGYYGHALHVPLPKKTHFECRFPNEKFIGVL